MAQFNLDSYLAGIIDGEGCVSMSLNKDYLNMCVKVSMCERAAVDMLHKRFGGHFSDGVSKTKTGRHVYTWSVYNADCVEVLEMMSALAFVKREQAELALPIAQHMRTNQRRGVLSTEEKQARVDAATLIAALNKPVGKRLVLDGEMVAKYMEPKRLGGGKKVRLSDGREYETVSDAAEALGVSISAVSRAKRKGVTVQGLTVTEA